MSFQAVYQEIGNDVGHIQPLLIKGTWGGTLLAISGLLLAS
jgi:hypothetical protein